MMTGGGRIIMHAGARHWDQYRNTGLVQAARSLQMEIRPAGDMMRGRELIRRDLGKATVSGPAFCATPSATWTLRALAGGYHRPTHNGRVADEAEPGTYRILMEGIEALCGLFAFGLDEDDVDLPANWAYSPDGRRYRSAMPARMRN